MRILVITPKYYPDSFSVILIAEALHNQGHEVEVLTSCPFDDNGVFLPNHINDEIVNDIQIYRLKVTPRQKSVTSLIKNYLSFYRLSKKWVRKTNKQYDAVYTFGISPVVGLAAGNMYAKKHHVIHVVHLLDIWPEALIASGYARYNSLLYYVLRIWSKKLYNGANKILVGSPSYINYLKNDLRVDKPSIDFLPQPALVAKNESFNNPYDKTKFNYLYIGSISKTQLMHLFVPAMKKINRQDIVVNIIGKGQYKDELLKEIEEANLTNQIVYRGYVNFNDSYPYYKYADAVIASLNNEGFEGKTIPNKLISAMFYEKPVLAMLGGDGREIIEKSEGGLIVEQGVDELAKGISDMANLVPNFLRDMGLKNSRYYREHFDIDILIKKLLSSLASE